MSKLIEALNDIKCRIEQGLQDMENEPEVSGYYSLDDREAEEKYSRYKSAMKAASGKISDAIFDLKMVAYQHDPKSPLYEAIHMLPSEYSNNIYVLKENKDIRRSFYLIDKFIAFYNEKE